MTGNVRVTEDILARIRSLRDEASRLKKEEELLVSTIKEAIEEGRMEPHQQTENYLMYIEVQNRTNIDRKKLTALVGEKFLIDNKVLTSSQVKCLKVVDKTDAKLSIAGMSGEEVA